MKEKASKTPVKQFSDEILKMDLKMSSKLNLIKRLIAKKFKAIKNLNSCIHEKKIKFEREN